MPIEYVSDWPASASDFPEVVTSLFAISELGANLLLNSSSIMSSLTLLHSFTLKFFTFDPMRYYQSLLD